MKFDQEAKDRVVRLVEDRILAEGLSIQQACQVVAPKLGVSWHTARRYSKHARPVRSHGLRKTWLLGMLGCAGRIKNCAIRTSC